MFYGWKISSVGSFSNMMLQGSSVYLMNAFMEPLCAVNGWTRGELNFSLGISAFVGLIGMPIIAALAERFSLRLMMVLGALIGGGAMSLLGCTDQLWLFTIFNTLIWIFGQSCGGVVANALINNWFVRYRGRAFGLVNMGTSISGVILPFLSLLLIEAFGVRFSYLVLGGLTLSIAPISYFFVRDTPAVLGLFPDGDTTEIPLTEASSEDLPVSTILRIPEVYYIGLAFGLALLVSSGVMSQMKPHFSDLGLTSYAAMGLTCFSALCAAVSKYWWGWFCDRTNPVFASRAIMLSSTLSLMFAFLPQNFGTALLFSFVFGICVGGYWTVLPAVIAYEFGTTHFIHYYKVISIFIILRAGGFLLQGVSYELTGGYTLSYVLSIGILCIAFGCTLFLGRKSFHRQP